MERMGSASLDLHFFPGRAGIPLSMVSGYQSFEGPDPVEWVEKGYAVVDFNARGAFGSEGDVEYVIVLLSTNEDVKRKRVYRRLYPASWES